jgi:hypothetical protein
MVEGTARPRRLEHRYHACRKQERFEAPEGGTYRRSEDLFKFVFCEISSRDKAPHTASIVENGLSFIETSALDDSNVESAFQTILTGMVLNFPPRLDIHGTYFTR